MCECSQLCSESPLAPPNRIAIELALLVCAGVVVNAAIVAGKAARPASGSDGTGTGKIPTYLGSISVQRGRCIVTVSPMSIAVDHRSLSWSHNASLSCGQRGRFRVDIVAGKQVSIYVKSTSLVNK